MHSKLVVFLFLFFLTMLASCSIGKVISDPKVWDESEELIQEIIHDELAISIQEF